MHTHIQKLCDAGLNIVEIPPIDGRPVKAPTSLGWNRPRTTNNPKGYSHNAADFAHCNGFNLGLYHGASNTLALDLDNVEQAIKVFNDTTDLQLQAWLKNESRVEIKSPKANRGKLLFKLPPGFDAGLRQFKHESAVIFELRCGNCQDVIFGQHPEGGNYQLIGDPAKIPDTPAVLLDMLQNWDDWKPCLESALGIEQTPPKIKPRPQQQGEHLPGSRDPIKEFNQSYGCATVLLEAGYRQAGKDRFIRPGSTSKAPGAVILRNCADGIERVFSHGGDALNDGYAHDAFDLMRLLECGGDWATALSRNPEITKHNQQLFRQEKAAQQQKTSKAPPPPPDQVFTGDTDISNVPDFPPIGEQSPPKTENPQFNLVNIADVFTNAPEPQGYIWAGRIPYGVVTLGNSQKIPPTNFLQVET